MIRTLVATVLAAFAFSAFAAVDANQASAAELDAVKGIGPSLATKIVDARKAGNFKNWDDMVDRVPGVGSANAMRLSDAGLTVGGSRYTPAPKAAKAPTPAAKAAAPEAKNAKTAKAEKI